MIQHSHKTEIINNFTVLFTKTLIHLPCIKDLYQRLCITECRNGERNAGNSGNGGNVIFLGMLPKSRVNVAKHSVNILKHSRECRQKFRGMSPNIPGHVLKHSGECHLIFWGMPSNIYCRLQMMLSKGRLSKSTVGRISFCQANH